MSALEVDLSYPETLVGRRATPYGLLLTLDGAAGIGEPGAPGLPRAVVRIALPEGAVAAGVTATPLSTVELSAGPVLLAPVQPLRAGKPSRRGGPGGPLTEPVAPVRVALPDPERYAVDPSRPLAVLLDPGDAEVPVATVEVNPLAVDRAGRLVLHERVRVVIQYAKIRLDGRRRFRDQREAVDHLRMLRQLVVNPELMELDHGPGAVDALSAEYLVITDRHRWDAETITRGAPVDGDPVAEFGRLTAWKRARGLTARVVTVEDIVDGRYGDFGASPPRRTARDLPEAIRQFLKHARAAWGTRWVLLGGEPGIVPIRVVAGELRGDVAPGAEDPPPPGRSVGRDGRLRMNTEGLAEWWAPSAGNTLLRPDTGAVIPFDPTGTAAPGWHFTDASYTAPSSAPTDHVVVTGVGPMPLRWLYTWNRIPTDFYYASLVGPDYDRPGRHDWDPRGAGVYGDGITWQAHLSVGRAPIRTGADAAAFVDKVLAYEQLPESGYWIGGHVYEREMVIAADNWGGRVGVYPTSLAGPGENEFTAGVGPTLLRLTSGEVPITYDLYAQVTPDDLRLIPYDDQAGPARRGWFYTASPTEVGPSVLPGIGVPVPTPHIAVFSGDPAELAPQLFVLDEPVADSSLSDQELVAGIVNSVLRGVPDLRRLYADEVDLPGSQHLSTAALTAALNQGPHLVSMSGHGSPWGGVCGLDSWLAGSLSNGEPGFIAYADSCLTAAVDQASMGERLLTNPDGGAVAYVGNTRFSWIGCGDDFQRLFWQRLATTPHLGLLADSRCELVHAAGLQPAAARWAILSLNLLGDPELPVWQRRPRRLRVPESIARIPNWEWTVLDERGRPVPEAVVTVTGRDRPASVRADRRGVVRFDLTTRPDERVEVVVTAPAHRPARVILPLSDPPVTPDWRNFREVVGSDPR